MGAPNFLLPRAPYNLVTPLVKLETRDACTKKRHDFFLSQGNSFYEELLFAFSFLQNGCCRNKMATLLTCFVLYLLVSRIN